MKKSKLEDIDKKHILKAPPERYFDELPGIIQAQAAHKTNSKKQFLWSGALKYALPSAAVLILVFLIGFFSQQERVDPEGMIAEVAVEDLIAYLEETDITTEELIASVEWDESSLNFDMELEETNVLDEMELEEDEILELFQEYDIPDEYL